jgi:hypothetical protein
MILTSQAAKQTADTCQRAMHLIGNLLTVYIMACEVMSPTPDLSSEAASPAAPAAVRLILTTFQTCSRLQQLAGRDGSPAPVLLGLVALLANDGVFAERCVYTLAKAHWAMIELLKVPDALRCSSSSSSRSTEGSPTACSIGALLSSDLVPCLAITVLVATLGLDTSGNMLGGSSATYSSSSGAGSSTAVQAWTAQHPSQQAVPASGSSSSSTSSSERLGNGISLDSLTPLSRGLFGLLGVDQGVLRQAAEGVDAVWGSGFEPDYFGGIVGACCGVLVDQLSR